MATHRTFTWTWVIAAVRPSGSAPRAGHLSVTIASTFGAPPGTSRARAEPRRIDRAAPPLRQSRRGRFPALDRLDGRRAPACWSLSHHGALRGARRDQDHPGANHRAPDRRSRKTNAGRSWNDLRLIGAAANRWLLAYDNIRVIPDWLSDALCLLSTGGAVAGNSPLSGDGPAIWHAERPVILNGIEEFVGRSDLSDRSVLLHLPPINPQTPLPGIVLAVVPRGLSANPGGLARRRRGRLARAAIGPNFRIASHGRLRHICRGGRPIARLAGQHGSLRLRRQSPGSNPALHSGFAGGRLPSRDELPQARLDPVRHRPAR